MRRQCYLEAHSQRTNTKWLFTETEVVQGAVDLVEEALEDVGVVEVDLELPEDEVDPRVLQEAAEEGAEEAEVAFEVEEASLYLTVHV